MEEFNVMLFLSVLFVSVQVATSICCDEIRSNVNQKELAHTTLCSTVIPELANCCEKLRNEIKKQRIAYKTLCPGLLSFVRRLNLLCICS